MHQGAHQHQAGDRHARRAPSGSKGRRPAGRACRDRAGAGRSHSPAMIAVNVAGLLHEAHGATRELRLRDHYTSLGPDLELAGPMNGVVRLQRTNRGILARGTVTAPMRRTCARCLEPYVEDVTVAIDDEFLPSLDPNGQPL